MELLTAKYFSSSTHPLLKDDTANNLAISFYTEIQFVHLLLKGKQQKTNQPAYFQNALELTDDVKV